MITFFDVKPVFTVAVQSCGWAEEGLPSKTLIFKFSELGIRWSFGDLNYACGLISLKCSAIYWQ